MKLLHSWVFRLALLVISLGLCLSAGSTIIGLLHRRDLITSRQKDLQKVTKENTKLQRELDETRLDSYVERIARDKLGLVKEGETIVLLPQSEVQSNKREAEDARHNWQKWLGVFY